MAQNALLARENPYLERVMRYVVPILSIAVSIFAISGIIGIANAARRDLLAEHETGLKRVSLSITNEIGHFAEDGQQLIVDEELRRYLTNAQDITGTQARQRASDLIEQHSEDYLAIRYISRAGTVQLETLNVNSIAQRTPLNQLNYRSPQADSDAFQTALHADETQAVIGDFRLRRDNTGQALPQLVFDIYIPLYLSSFSDTAFGIIQMEVLATNLLNHANLALKASEHAISDRSGRHVLIVDSLGRIVADSGAISDDYIDNLEATGGNVTGVHLYEGLTTFLTENPEDTAIRYHQSTNQIYSTSTLLDNTLLGLDWKLVILDNPLTYFLGAVGAISSIVVLAFIVPILATLLIRRLLTPLLYPVAEASDFLQDVTSQQDRQGLSQRPMPASSDNELVSSVRGLAERLQQLDGELDKQVRRRNRDLQVAGRIGREAAAQSDLDALARRAINLICNELGFYHAQVFLLDEAKTTAILRYSRGEAGQKLIERGHQIAVGSDTLIGTVTSQRRPVIVNDTLSSGGNDPHRFNPLLPETRAEMALPLIIGEEVMGALDIQSRNANAFSLDDAPTYQLLADQLAIAIYNGQLREQTQRRIQQIDRLNRQLTRDAWNQVEEKLGLEAEYGAKNIIGKVKAPISIRGEVIGDLHADLPEGQQFSLGDQMVMQAVAERVALAIENARLFQETQSSLSETSTLYKLSRLLNEANSLEDVLQAIIVTVAPNAAGGQVWLFDETLPGEDPEWVRLSIDLAILPRPINNRVIGQRLRMEDYEFFRRMSGNAVTTIEDASKISMNSGSLLEILTSLNARSLVFIPLNMRGVWKGFLSIEFDTPYHFNERELRIYNALIAQAGVAIDNRLLLQQTEDSLTRQEKLYAASRIINTSQSLADLVYAAVATTSEDGLDFWLALLEKSRSEQGADYARIVAKSLKRVVSEANESHELLVSLTNFIQRREPEIIQDKGTGESTPSLEWIRQLGYRFMAIFPLFSDNQPIALFYIVSTEAYELSLDDYEVYKALTGQMSTQIQNRRLLERTESALSETRRLYVATRAITGAQDKYQIYDTVAGHLTRAMLQQMDEHFEFSISILLSKPTPAVDAPQLLYEYQWLSELSNTPDVPVGMVISQEDAPFGMMISESEDNILLYRNIERDVPREFPMIADIMKQNGAIAAAATPLWSRQQWYGMLIIRSSDASVFDESYLRFLQSIGDQVAVAIENQSLLQETERERERLNTTLSTLPTGVLVLDPETFEPINHNDRLEELLGRPVQYHEAFKASTYNMFRTGTQLFYPDEELAIYQAQRMNRPMLGDDIAILHDYGQTDLLLTAAPIYNPDGTQRSIVAAFQDISTLRSMENTMQENLRETVLLYETQRALSESETLEELLDNIIGQLAMQQPADAYIIMADNGDEGDTVTLARSLVQPLENEVALMPILGETLMSINDIEHSTLLDEEGRQVLLNVGAQSVMILPLTSRSRLRPLGWMLIIDVRPNAFNSDQERTMKSVSDMASTAIDNSYLVESTQDALRETADLYNATTTISRSKSLADIYQALEVALITLEADMYACFMIEGEELRTKFQSNFEESVANGLDFDQLMHIRLPHDEGLFISDLSRSTIGNFEREVFKAQNIQAIAALNLRIKDVPKGRLYVAYTKPHHFDEGNRRFLSAVADSASVVIDNKGLLEQVQSTLHETTVLYQASKALLETSEPEQIIQVIATHLIESHINQVFIALLNTPSWEMSGAAVEVVASWQSHSDVDLLGVSLSPEQFPAWRQLSTDSSVLVIEDIYDPRYGLDPLEQTSIESLDTRSLVVLPLRVPSRAIGAIWLGSREAHVYTEADLRVFQTFAEQTSLSLEAQRLLEQTEERARQLQTSAAISQSVSQILDLDILLPQVVDLIKDQFGYDHVQIFLMDENNEWAVLEASTGEAGEKLLSINHKLARASESVIGKVTELGQPTVALDTADANVVHQPNPYLPLTRSELALPLAIKGNVVGALDVQSNQPNAFSDEDVQVLLSLANQIAVAIENARLYANSARSANEMAFLFEVTTAAASAETLDNALKQVANEIQSSMQAHIVAFYLPQEYEDYNGNRKTMLEVEAVASDAEVNYEKVESVEVGNAENIIGMVGSTLQSQLIPNVERDVRYYPFSDKARSAVVVPISSGSQLIGLVVLESLRLNAFTNETLTLLMTLAGSLAAVIQNSLLLGRLQQTNDRLREVDRLKSQFLASMSHELRTPLNSIIGFSRVMLKGIDGALTEMQEQDLTTIYNSGNHLLNLINDILDQAKIEADELNLKFSFFDVKPMIESVRSIAIGMLKEKHLDLYVEIAPNMPQAFGDEFRSRQILLNLVSNAIKFTPSGSVTIAAYAAEGDDPDAPPVVRIDVTDSGIGIAEKDMPILFEQFRQIDNSLTRTVGGTGLGLPISKALAEMQGGGLIVYSEVNVGSTFSVVIPTVQGAEDVLEKQRDERRRQKDKPMEGGSFDPNASGLIKKSDVEKARKMADQAKNGEKAEAPKASQAPKAPQKPISRAGVAKKVLNEQRMVLLIEDNKEMVDQFRRMLQREGFEVQTAEHPAYAEAMVGQLRPNVVLLDVNFAEGKGWGVLQSLKERDDTFDIPIVVTTIASDSEAAYRLGAHIFIQRPFLPDDLINGVLDAERESRRERILIIDDQPEAIRLLTQLLGEHGNFRIFSAETGDEGISLVARRRPDLIILDLRMPNKDGFAVLDELRGNPETAKIPVLVVTGDIDLSSSEKEALQNVTILPKSDISQEQYEHFIDNVRSYLESRNGK